MKNINTEFLVSDVFNKYFAPFKNGTNIITAMTDKYLQLPMRKETFYCGVNSIFVNKEWSFFDHNPTYYNGTKSHEVKFTMGSGNGNGHMYFTENGEIANRDYNQDFNDPIPFLSVEESVSQYLGIIDKLINGPLEKSSKNYFCNGYAIKIFDIYQWSENKLYVTFIPEVKTGVYYIQGESGNKITKPKKGLTNVSKDEFLMTISQLLKKVTDYEKND